MDVFQEVLAAETRIRGYVRQTPLRIASRLSQTIRGKVYLKLENLQHTGSFKVRGALNKLLSCTSSERQRGIITASTGNHGLAVAHALSVLGMRGAIYLPETASEHKIAKLRQFDVDIVFHGQDGVEAEREARRVSVEQGQVYVSPYNDPAVIGGQGTLAVELLRRITGVDMVLLSVGGGGLIAGVAGYLKEKLPAVQVIGCSPQASPIMHESIRAGTIVDRPVQCTLSDGTAGGIEKGAITYELCRSLVDDWLLVEEPAIAHAMKQIHEDERMIIEGSAGVTVASLLKHGARFEGKTVALIICGGNVAMNQFAEIIR